MTGDLSRSFTWWNALLIICRTNDDPAVMTEADRRFVVTYNSRPIRTSTLLGIHGHRTL